MPWCAAADGERAAAACRAARPVAPPRSPRRRRGGAPRGRGWRGASARGRRPRVHGRCGEMRRPESAPSPRRRPGTAPSEVHARWWRRHGAGAGGAGGAAPDAPTARPACPALPARVPRRGVSRFGNPPVAAPAVSEGARSPSPRSPSASRSRITLSGQEVLPLLAQDPAQALDVGLEELAVPRRRALRVHQALALQEADFGDGDVGELLTQQRQDVPDREVRTGGHSFPATR